MAETSPDAPAHTCHWPGCTQQVAPALWGCRKHWFKLPMRLRQRIWRHYRAGQEVTKTPSAEYLAAARDVQAWIREHLDQLAAKVHGHD